MVLSSAFFYFKNIVRKKHTFFVFTDKKEERRGYVVLEYTHPLTTFVVCLVLGVLMTTWEMIEKKSIQAGVRCMNLVTLFSAFTIAFVHFIYLLAPQFWRQ